MDKDILMALSFIILLIILDLLIKNKKPKNWLTWVGLVLTAGVGASFISGLFSGSLLQSGIDYLIAGIFMLVLGIYFLLRKPKEKKRK